MSTLEKRQSFQVIAGSLGFEPIDEGYMGGVTFVKVTEGEGDGESRLGVALDPGNIYLWSDYRYADDLAWTQTGISLTPEVWEVLDRIKVWEEAWRDAESKAEANPQGPPF